MTITTNEKDVTDSLFNDLADIVDIMDIELEFTDYEDDDITVDGITSSRVNSDDYATHTSRPIFELEDDHYEDCAFCKSGYVYLNMANSESEHYNIMNIVDSTGVVIK